MRKTKPECNIIRGKHLPILLPVCMLLCVTLLWKMEGDRQSSVETHEYLQTHLQMMKPVTVEMAAELSKRICTQNPYLQSLADPLETIAIKMNEMLTHVRIAQGTEATKEIYQLEDHRRFFPFNPLTKCTDQQCIGGPCHSDESKVVCGLQQLGANSTMTSSIRKNYADDTCVIYSLGSNNLWGFELDVLDKTPCQVHTFDCTGARSRFKVPQNPRLTFHHVCLTAYPRDPSVPRTKKIPRGKSMVGESWTLLEMQQKLGHKRIDLLKIDVEGAEIGLFRSWPQLEHLEESEKLLMPMQILVEVHYHKTLLSAMDLVELQNHLLHMGYIVVNRADNPRCTGCTELTLMRVRCPGTGVHNQLS